MLAHHNPVGANHPHHRRAVFAILELVVDLGAFVGTLDGGAAFVDEFPGFRTARHFRKQTRIVRALGMEGASVPGIGTRIVARTGRSVFHQGTFPFVAFLPTVETIMLHFQMGATNRDALGRKLDVAAGFDLLGGTDIQINERFAVLVQEQVVNGAGIVSGVENEFFHRAQGGTLRKFNDPENEADSIMAGSRMQSGIQRQVVGTVGRCEGIQGITVEEPFTRAVPTGVAIRLGIQPRMVTLRKTAGTTIASRFAAGIGGSCNGHAVTGDGQPVHISEQTEFCGYGKISILKQRKQPIRRQLDRLIEMAHHPVHQTLNTAGSSSWGFSPFLLPLLRFAFAPLFPGFEALGIRAPETGEEIVEGADAGNVAGFEAAEDGIEAVSVQLVDPFGDAEIRPNEEHQEIRTQHGSRVTWRGTEGGVRILQQRSDAGQIGDKQFEDHGPVVFAQQDEAV